MALVGAKKALSCLVLGASTIGYVLATSPASSC